MLALTAFLGDTDRPIKTADTCALADAFRLTGFFLIRNVFEPRGVSASSVRDSFVQAVLKGLAAPQGQPMMQDAQ